MQKLEQETPYEQVDVIIVLEPMLSLLAQALYPRPDVAIRELLANSVDALHKKQYLIQRGEILDDGVPPRITVKYDVTRHQLVVEDTGCGMTETEIKQYVLQIGVSGAEAYEERDRDRDLLKKLIGQFGIGLLACFKLGERVTILTRSVREEGPLGVELVNEDASKQAKMRRVPIPRAGTTVTVSVTKQEHQALLMTKLQTLVRHYGDLLPFPIFDAMGNQINSFGNVPWDGALRDDHAALKRYLVERAKPDRINDPLWVIPVRPGVDIEMHGVVYIPDDRSFINREGSIDLYVKRMLVRKDLPGILPQNLMFCHGVVDCPDLTMIMSREDVMRDSQFEKFRRELARQVTLGLRDLAARQNDFDRVQALFDQELKVAVVGNDELFDVLADSLCFWVGATERKSLREYSEEARRRGDAERRNHIYYLSSVGSAQARYQVDLMLQQKGLQAIEIVELPPQKKPGSEEIVQPPSLDRKVLEKYAEKRGMRLIPASQAVDAFADQSDKSWDTVKAVFLSVQPHRANWDVRVTGFEPRDLPILLRAEDMSTLAERLHALDMAVARLVQEHGESITDIEDVLQAAKKHLQSQATALQFVLNSSNQLMQEFKNALNDPRYREYDKNFEHARRIAGELYHLALQYTGYAMDESSMNVIVEWRTKLVGHYLNLLLAQAAICSEPRGGH